MLVRREVNLKVNTETMKYMLISCHVTVGQTHCIKASNKTLKCDNIHIFRNYGNKYELHFPENYEHVKTRKCLLPEFRMYQKTYILKYTNYNFYLMFWSFTLVQVD